jgi:hypothetical protein
MREANQAALDDWTHLVDTSPAPSPASMAASQKISREVWYAGRLFGEDQLALESSAAATDLARARLMEQHFAEHPERNAYLMSGVQLSADLLGEWTIVYPSFEVPDETEGPGTPYLVNLAPAFSLYTRHRKWLDARRLARAYPEGLISPSLRGWAAVAEAECKPRRADHFFEKAAAEFKSDVSPVTPEDLQARGGTWSAVNVVLWAGYFRARACLVRGVRDPSSITEELLKAKYALDSVEGYAAANVTRLRVLVRSLAILVSDPEAYDEAAALKEYELAMRITGVRAGDRSAQEFLTKAGEYFRAIATDPRVALTKGALHEALTALAKVPVLTPGASEAVQQPLGQSAFDLLLGPIRTELHRALEKITNEAVFRKVLLRLLQSRSPAYAQIRHGPFEYGKDVAALVEVDGVPVLRLYQAKVGDIKKAQWYGCREQLEEIFLVPMSQFQLPITPQRIEAFLVTTGHATDHVEPIIAAWISAQKESQGRSIEFFHLDRLVQWIVGNKLTKECLESLKEFSQGGQRTQRRKPRKSRARKSRRK